MKKPKRAARWRSRRANSHAGRAGNPSQPFPDAQPRSRLTKCDGPNTGRSALVPEERSRDHAVRPRVPRPARREPEVPSRDPEKPSLEFAAHPRVPEVHSRAPESRPRDSASPWRAPETAPRTPETLPRTPKTQPKARETTAQSTSAADNSAPFSGKRAADQGKLNATPLRQLENALRGRSTGRAR